MTQAKPSNLATGLPSRQQPSQKATLHQDTAQDGNPFAYHPPGAMMRTLPSLQTSFTSAGVACFEPCVLVLLRQIGHGVALWSFEQSLPDK